MAVFVASGQGVIGAGSGWVRRKMYYERNEGIGE